MADALAAAGHAVTVIVPDFAQTPPFPMSAAIDLRVVRTPGWLPGAARQLAYYAALAIGSARGYDVCVVPYSLTVLTSWLSSLLAGGRCRVLYLVSAYEPETHGALAESAPVGRVVRRALAALSYRVPAHRVYVSRWLARRVGEPAAPTISLGIDHDVFHPRGRAASGAPRVGVIARRGPVKGYADFLAAWRLLADAPELTIVRVDPVEVPPGATVLGRLSAAEMAGFYRSVDVFVFPSLSEGFPAPPLEAMACGAAVVATRSGGVEEYASDGVNCLLVPVSDPRSLAAAIARLVRDPDLRARLASESIRTAARFTWDETASATVRLVEAISGSR